MHRKSYYFPEKLAQNLKPILEAPLTLISAGVGFGKTTAVSCYLKSNLSSEKNIRWYTCFENPPWQIWSDLCTLLETADAITARQLQKLNTPTQDNLNYICLLAESISCEKETYLVIDNYQNCGFAAPDQVLNALACHRCPRLHLIFLSQPLSQYSFHITNNSNIYCLDQKHFVFHAKDIQMLFACNGIRLNNEETQYLWENTGGWLAPLCLHLSSYLTDQRPGAKLRINELIEEIFWSVLDREQKDFFLMLSQLNTFGEKQAAILLDQEEISEPFWQFIRKNAFVYPVGREYTLHSLLQEFLDEKFKNRKESFQQEGMRRAAHAFRSQGKNREAFLLFLHIGADTQALATDLTSQDLTELIKSDHICLNTLLKRCPDELLLKNCELLLGITIKSSLRNKGELTQLCLRRLEGLINLLAAPADCKDISCPDTSENETVLKKLYASLELIRSFQAYNNVAKMSLHHQNVLSYLDIPENFYLTNDPWTFCIPSPVFMFYRSTGQLEETCRQVAEGIPYYAQFTGNKGMGAPEVMRSEYLLLSGNTDNSEMVAHQGYYKAAQYNQDSLCFAADLILCRLALVKQNPRLFKTHFEAIQRRAFDGTEFFCLTMSEICQAFLYMVLGLENKIPSWFSEQTSISRNLYPISVPYAKIIQSRLLRQENPNRFLGIVTEFDEEASRLHVQLPRIYFRLEQACAYLQLKKTEKAAQSVCLALTQALPDQIYLPFAEFYGELSSIYQELEKQPRFTPDLIKIKAIGHGMVQGCVKARSLLLPGTSALTPREREIALLARQRLSNQEIGEKLCISSATVKNTLYKIYAKLNIHGKAELKDLEI